jgi:hypothetical protein
MGRLRSKIGLSFALGAVLLVAVFLSISTQTTTTLAYEVMADYNSTDKSAHVVIQFADGTTAVRPITWTGTISRVTALEMAGFTVEYNGDTICSINEEGCPASDCFCPTNLWAQGQWVLQAWDTTAWPPPRLMDGDVIAFRNGTQPDYSDWGLWGKLPGAATYVAASDALEWLRAQQRADGSYMDGFGKMGASVRALQSLGSAGYNPAKWGDPSLLNFLTVVSKTQTVEYAASSAAAAGKLTLGAAWTKQPLTDFASINLPISITTYYSPTIGAYGTGSGDTAWAMLGLHAAGREIPAKAVEFLKSVQNDDGGWAWNEWGATSETQHTAVCLQALLAAGESPASPAISKALIFLDEARNADFGAPYTAPGDSDVNSTAYALQGLLSAGRVPTGNWCTAIQDKYLLTVQQGDGSLPGFSPLYATQEAIPALMHRHYGPLAAWSYVCYGLDLPLVFGLQPQ